MIQGEGMPTSTKRKVAPPVVEDDEEELDEEEEVRPARRPKTSAAASTKTSTNGTARKPRPSEQAETMPRTKKVVAAPTGTSARDYALAILLEGAPRDEVKKRAIALAKSEGADVSWKTFDVSYYIKYLGEKKNYRIIEKNGTVRVIAPKG